VLRELTRHVVVMLIATLASKAAALLLVPVYTRYLPPSDMGLVSLLVNFATVVGIATTMGVQSATFMCYLNEADEERRRRVVGTAIRMMVAISAASALLLVALVGPVNRLLLGGHGAREYLATVAYLVASNLSGLVLVLVRVRGRTGVFALISVAQFLVSLGLTIYLVVVVRWGVMGVIVGMLVSALVPLPLLVQFRDGLVAPAAWDIVRQYLRLGAPIALGNVFYWGAASANRFFLDRYLSRADVGLFDIASRFGLLTQVLVILPFFQAWNYLMFKVREAPDAREVFADILSLYTILCFGCSAAGIVLIKPIAALFIAPQYHSSLPVMATLMVAAAASGFHYYLVFGTSINNVVIEQKTTFGSAVVATVLNVALIPTLGLQGAGVALLAANATLSLITGLYSRRYYPIPIRWRYVLAPVAGCLLAWLASPFLRGAGAGVVALATALVVVAYGGLLTLALRDRWARLRSFARTTAAGTTPATSEAASGSGLL
jgi:O-antigen/teichoic acid export membrane protein